MSLSVELPDFDALVALHRQDPEAFENFRRHALREAIERAPLAHRPALEQLLRRINSARAAAGTPMEAVLIATRMMHESVVQLRDSWEQTRQAVAGLQASLIIERVRR